MSADNYLLIRKENSNWVAYMESASNEEPGYGFKEFITDTVENAIISAQEVDTEYGYRFEMDMLDKQSSTSNKEYSPKVCKYCGNIQREVSKGINMDGMHGTEFLNYDHTS